MFIPLHDANGLQHIRAQYVTIGLILTNVIVYLLTALGSRNFTNATMLGLGYIPSTVHNIVERPPELVLVPDYLTYVTYAFLHGDIFHLGGNMLFLWVSATMSKMRSAISAIWSFTSCARLPGRSRTAWPPPPRRRL